tara:strand:- start:9743 stop:9994 length:252 start_codon:yes stop_codon:yes gene_type:complete
MSNTKECMPDEIYTREDFNEYIEAIGMYQDRNGRVIMDGNTIHNPHNDPSKMKVKMIKGEMCFLDGNSLSKYQTKNYWEVVVN